MDTSEKNLSKRALEPPFPHTSSLISREDIVIPAAFNDLSSAAKNIKPLRIADTVAVHVYLSAIPTYLDSTAFVTYYG
jgi:hypothetical protein